MTGPGRKAVTIGPHELDEHQRVELIALTAAAVNRGAHRRDRARVHRECAKAASSCRSLGKAVLSLDRRHPAPATHT